MSTALSTEMPTSAARRAGASLMPSPMKPTTWPFALERLDDALLVRGREAREDVGPSTASASCASGHRLDLAAEQDFFRINADFGADLARDEVVVAGQHFDGDAVLAQRGDGFGGGVLGRIEEGEIAGQDQIAFVGLGVGGLLLHFLGGHGQHAKAVLAQVVDLLDEVADQNRLHRENLAFALEMGALGEDGFRRALGQQLPLAIRALDHDRHHAAGEIERDFIHLRVFLEREFAVQFLCAAARRGRGRSSGRSENG